MFDTFLFLLLLLALQFLPSVAKQFLTWDKPELLVPLICPVSRGCDSLSSFPPFILSIVELVYSTYEKAEAQKGK